MADNRLPISIKKLPGGYRLQFADGKSSLMVTAPIPASRMGQSVALPRLQGRLVGVIDQKASSPHQCVLVP